MEDQPNLNVSFQYHEDGHFRFLIEDGGKQVIEMLLTVEDFEAMAYGMVRAVKNVNLMQAQRYSLSDKNG